MNVTDFKAKDAVRLRTKPIKNGNLSLYLDIYHKGRRRYEFLRLYLIPEHNSQDRNRNRHSLEVAHRIRNRRLAELQETLYTDRHNLHRQRLNFLDYIDTFCQNHGAAYRSLSMGLKRHLILYKGPVIPFSSITKSFLRGFHHYLNQAQAGGNVSKHSARLLSAGTKWNYFNILSLLLNKACREGYFLRNPMHELSAEERPPSFRTSENLPRHSRSASPGCYPLAPASRGEASLPLCLPVRASFLRCEAPTVE